MNRFCLALLALAALCPPGFAAAALFTPSMSCKAVANKVMLSGAILLYTGRDRYDRYVSDQRGCERDEVATPAWAPAADNPQCFVGYTCEHQYD
jgi:hypothetical protein